ncbi:hypothetical protein J6590_019711 [Homalodisca vitripennis]|nr:hypothetical protein J6590_019711 [Homalodisca vitripennis]
MSPAKIHRLPCEVYGGTVMSVVKFGMGQSIHNNHALWNSQQFLLVEWRHTSPHVKVKATQALSPQKIIATLELESLLRNLDQAQGTKRSTKSYDCMLDIELKMTLHRFECVSIVDISLSHEWELNEFKDVNVVDRTATMRGKGSGGIPLPKAKAFQFQMADIRVD